jgi:hypothetical protein
MNVKTVLVLMPSDQRYERECPLVLLVRFAV